MKNLDFSKIKQLTAKIESGFYHLGLWIYDHCWLTIIVILLPALLLLSQLFKLRMDTSFEGYFAKSSTQYQSYQAFKKEFVQDKIALIHVQPPAVFDLAFLEKLKQFHEALETQVPHLENVFSLMNIPSVAAADGDLRVEELLKKWPETPEDLVALKKRVLENPVYQNYFIDKAGTATLIAVEPNIDLSQKPLDIRQKLKRLLALDMGGLTDSPNRQFVRAIQKLVKEFSSQDFPLQVSGLSVLEQNFEEKLQEDAIVLTSLLVGMLALLSALLFRRLAGVLLPLLVVGLALFCSLGAMAFFDVPVSTISVLLPLIILTTGVGDSVHFLTSFFERHGETGERREAIAHALAHSGIAMAMTSLTTAAGLLSFGTVNFIHVIALGLFGALGVTLVLIFSILLLPALLSAVPLARKTHQDGTIRLLPKLEKVTGMLGIMAWSHPWKVVLAWTVICGIAIMGIIHLNFSFHVLNWFPPHDDFRLAAEAVDRSMKGSVNLDVIIDTGKVDGIYNPELMKRLDEANHLIKKIDVVGQSTSIVDILKQIHYSLNERYDSDLPDSTSLIAKEMLIFESGSAGNLARLVNFDASKARINIRVPWVDVSTYDEQFYQVLVPSLEEKFKDFGTIITTGLGVLFLNAFHMLMGNMLWSYANATVVITLIMIITLRSIKLGMVSMIPNIVPIVIGIGVMGALQMPFDAVSIVMACVALGVVMDDTVHFLFNFERFMSQTNDARKAIELTIQESSRGMVFTSLMLAGGYFIFSLAYIEYLSNFGIISGIIIIAAGFADLTLTPAAVTLIYRKRQGLIS